MALILMEGNLPIGDDENDHNFNCLHNLKKQFQHHYPSLEINITSGRGFINLKILDLLSCEDTTINNPLLHDPLVSKSGLVHFTITISETMEKKNMKILQPFDTLKIRYSSDLRSKLVEEYLQKLFSSLEGRVVNHQQIHSDYDFLKKLEILFYWSPLIRDLYSNNFMDDLITDKIAILNVSSEEDSEIGADVFSDPSNAICHCQCSEIKQWGCVSPRRHRPRPMPQPYYYEEIECEIDTPRMCEPECPPPAPPAASAPRAPSRRPSYRNAIIWTMVGLGYLLLLVALAVVAYSYFKVTTPPEEREFTNFLHFWDIT